MADFYNLLHRDSTNWQNCKLALAAKGIDMTNIPTDGFADKIREIATKDDLAITPELKHFPDIRAGLTDSTFKMVVLRNGTASIGIAITLPSGQSGSINWGDGNTTVLTASGATVNYYHTWSAWQTSGDGQEEYNIVTITGNITAVAAIASAVVSPRYWATVLWIAAKSSSLTSFALYAGSGAAIGHNLRRVDLDTPNMILGNYTFSGCYCLRSLIYNGAFGASGSLFAYTEIEELSITTSSANISLLAFGSRVRSLLLTLTTSASVNCTSICQNANSLRKFSTNSAWGSYQNAFNGCYALKEIDMSGCPVNGITDMTGWINLYSCTKILLPSTGTGSSRVPKAFAAGITSMGNIDISNSGLWRVALIDMFYSLPTNAATRNLTITGSVGAADLTAGELAIATSKNWVVIR